MRYELFDYQRDAAVGCVKNLIRGRRDWEDGHRSSFALSAITGSGKTVIATAVIEALLYGSADLGVDPDPRATFLWITDDPALNRQTRNKMLAASDLLQPARLSISTTVPRRGAVTRPRLLPEHPEAVEDRRPLAREATTFGSSPSGTSSPTRSRANRPTSTSSSMRPTGA